MFIVQITANWGYAMPRNDILSQIIAQIPMGAAQNHIKSSNTMVANRKNQFGGLRGFWSLKLKQSSLLRSIKAFYAFLGII